MTHFIKKLFSYAIALFILLCVNIVFADDIKSLYQAEIPINSQSVEERNAALLQALQQVLVRVSGNNEIINNPKIKEAMRNTKPLLEEYGYSQSNTQEGVSSYILTVKFDQEGVDQLLKNADAPIWSVERPLFLVWVEKEAPNQPAEFIDSSNEIQSLLKQYAEKRGVPIIFPMMDLSDLAQVTVNDVVTMAIPPLQNVAQRYKSNGLLILRVFEVAKGNEIKAKLVLGKDQWSWNLQAGALDENLKILVNNISDVLAKRYSTVVNKTVQTHMAIKVIGVGHHGDLRELVLYLKRLSPIADVTPTEVSGEEVVLSLSLRSSPESLAQAIGAENKLISVVDQDIKNRLVYRWNP